MKVLVMGAGIAGVTTAYELNRDGHEVTVIDREELESARRLGLAPPAPVQAPPAAETPSAPSETRSQVRISSWQRAATD